MQSYGTRNHRSLGCETEVGVYFWNQTKRPVAVVWLDYTGMPKLYKVLEAEQAFPMKTYESHPWIFEDSETGDRKLGGRQEVFYAQRPENMQHLLVPINTPMYSLREIALQKIRDSINDVNEITDLDLPMSVKNDLEEMMIRKLDRYLDSEVR